MKTLAALSAGIVLAANALLAANPSAEQLSSESSGNSFKPAQRDLTKVFLQIGSSLEQYGSPEPYLRHMAREHDRIEAKYRKVLGKPAQSYRPSYMTNDYLNKFAANWDALSPKLGLAPVTKDIGKLMQDSITGTRGSGTIIIESLNRHQKRVFDAMAGSGESVAFDALKAELITRLELDKPNVDEWKYETARRDAVSSALIIHGVTTKLFERLDQTAALKKPLEPRER